MIPGNDSYLYGFANFHILQRSFRSNCTRNMIKMFNVDSKREATLSDANENCNLIIVTRIHCTGTNMISARVTET